MATSAPAALRPLQHRSYRILAAGLALSLLGAGCLVIALVWQVVRLGGGPVDLSTVTAAEAVGLLAMVLPGGVLADRIRQRRLLVTAQAVKAAAAGLVAVGSLSGWVQIWHLMVLALVSGLADGVFYPAYSALLPALIPEEQLLAANGLEGAMRPMLLQAAGPAVAGILVAAWSPGLALASTGFIAAAAAVSMTQLDRIPVRRELPTGHTAAQAARHDLAEGFRYLRSTPWLMATLLYASVLVLLIMGPFDVLVPFVIKDQLGGGARDHALVLGAFGVGGALGALLMASGRLPRRYLTSMNLLWGLGCLPLAMIGFASALWVMVGAAFVCGLAFEAATVIWGTLLQRRVPAELLGRVSSLDFFVSMAFMPISMALAGPAAEAIGMRATFLVAGIAPTLLAVVAVLAARMPADELAHPLRSGTVA